MITSPPVCHHHPKLFSLATRASGPHPFPSRTRSLSLTAPMVLRSRDRGRVGRCRHPLRRPRHTPCAGGVVFPPPRCVRDTTSARDSAGVTIVEHERVTLASLPQLSLAATPIVCSGVTNGDEGDHFNRIVDATVRADGSIAVLERSLTLRVEGDRGCASGAQHSQSFAARRRVFRRRDGGRHAFAYHGVPGGQ